MWSFGGDWKCETGIIGTIENAGVENARLKLSAPNCRGWKMQDLNYRHHITGGGKCGTGIIGTKLQGGGKCGTKELWNAKAPCCSGSQKIICPIICWKYQCCNCVFQYYDSVSDRLDPYGYEMCVNLISFYVQCYGLQSVKRNTRNTQTYMHI